MTPRKTAVRRLSWSLADQAVSSATNFGLSLLLLRFAPTEQFGAFGLAFATYLLLLNVARAATSTPLLLLGTEEQRTRGALTVTLTLSVVGALALLTVASILSGPAGTVFFAFSVGLPALLAQDFFRFVALAEDRPHAALALDAIWLVVQALATALLFLADATTYPLLIAAWLTGALASALWAQAIFRRAPSLREAKTYFSASAHLVKALVPENLIQIAATQLTPFAVAAILSVSAVGSIRGAQTIMGPASMIYMGLMPPLTVQARKRVQPSHDELWRFGFLASASLAIFILLYGLTLVAVPSVWLAAVFGDNIAASTPILLPATFALAFQSLIAIQLTTLRFLAKPRSVALLRACVTCLDLTGTIVGAVTFGAVGAVSGSAASLALNTAVIGYLTWRTSHRAHNGAGSALLDRNLESAT